MFYESGTRQPTRQTGERLALGTITKRLMVRPSHAAQSTHRDLSRRRGASHAFHSMPNKSVWPYCFGCATRHTSHPRGVSPVRGDESGEARLSLGLVIREMLESRLCVAIDRTIAPNKPAFVRFHHFDETSRHVNIETIETHYSWG